MLSRKADDPPIVQVPSAAQDRPSWKTIGIIAAVGFLIGIVWPRLAGVRLGPSVPDASPAAASPAVSPSLVTMPPTVAPPKSLPSASASESVPAPSVSVSSAATSTPAISVTHTADRAPHADAPVVHQTGTPADGTAQVVWDVALIRDTPKTGKILARLPRGTTIHVGPVKDGWYPVKPGGGFAGEGWVFRGAIGR